MKKVLVTIIGISAKNPGKNMVGVGDQVLLMKEPTNRFDKNAIKVLTKDGENSVGYVGNGDKTVASGTKSATEVNSLLKDEVFGTIVDTTKVMFNGRGGSRESRAFIVEIVIEDEKQGEMNVNKELKFKLVGSKTIYPNKFRIAEELKAGNTPMVKLYPKDDKIVADFDGGLCGYVDTKKVEGLSLYEDIVSSVGGEKLAKITSQVGTNFIGVFTINEAELKREQQLKTLKATLKEIIDNGIATQDEIDERMEYLKKNSVTDKQILGLFATYKKYDPEVQVRIPKRPKTLYQDSNGIVRRSVAYVNMQRNLLFEGDRGVGKNVLLETLAWLYKRPLYEFALNSQHDNTAILGGKTLEADEKGNTVMGFDREAIVEAVEVGGMLELGEFNTSVAHVMTILNPVLDDRKRLQVPGYKEIRADSNFVAIGTQNRDYQGTFENNEATIDRFVPIIFPKLDNLADVLMAKGISDANLIRKCDTLFRGIKKCVEDGDISEKAITIRGFVDACMVVSEMDIPLKEALIDNIANRSTDLDDRKSIMNMIEDIIG